MTEPVRHGGSWYVAYSCSALSTPVYAVLYRADGDAETFEPVPGSTVEDAQYGPAVVVDDALLFPFGTTGALAGVTSID